MKSSELKGYLTGLILGDGTIGKGVTKRSFEIKSINRDFINQIFNDIKSCTNFHCRVSFHEGYTDKFGVNHKDSYVYTIFAHPYFNKKYNHFYTDTRNRRITNESLNWLNLQGIANWYMSDGYICLVGKTKGVIRDRRVDLCTDRYTKSDVEKIQKYFLKKWGWNTSIISRKTNKKVMYRIRFKKTDAQDLFVKIYQYIVPSFLYKLDMHYDYQPEWMTDEYYNLMLKIQQRERLNVAA